MKIIELLEEFLNHKKINCGFREQSFVSALDALHTLKKELTLQFEFNSDLGISRYNKFIIGQSVGYLMKVSQMESNTLTQSIIKELELEK